MSSSLRYVVVIPAGGGKTTLSQREEQAFLDVDALYNLRETNSTYDRMNAELERRAAVQEPVPISVAAEFRGRIANYKGPACCLLLHSVTLAEVSGLQMLAALIPSPELHKISTADRDTMGKWFAYQNVKCLERKCQQRQSKISRYSNWAELDQIVQNLLAVLPVARQRLQRSELDAVVLTREQQDNDEALLLGLCTLAVGCDFERSEPRSEDRQMDVAFWNQDGRHPPRPCAA